MIVEKNSINGLLVLSPKIHGDHRGYFLEAYNRDTFEKLTGEKIDFIQDNESFSSYGTMRGLHFQKPPFAQTKLVRVVKGEVLDVAVDLRKDSPTYGQYESVVLSEENKKQFLVPRGFAHGFIVLSETAIFSYKVDNYYAPDCDSGILYNDPALNIDWQLPESDIITSQKDKGLQSIDDYKSNPNF